MSAPVRLVLAGAGHVARAYAEALADAAELTISAVADPDLQAAERLASQLDTAVHPSLESALEGGEHDAVIVATPPDRHDALCRLALERGLPVLCEKPLVPTFAEARRLVADAGRHGRLLAMATKFRYVEAVLAARRLMNGGGLGRLVAWHIEFCSVADMSANWRSDPRIGGGGVLMDNGPHALDLAQFLAGPLERVLAETGPPRPGLEVEESVHLLVRATGGAIGQIHLSWGVAATSDAFLRLQGTGGVAEVAWSGGRWRATGGEWQSLGPAYDRRRALRAQVESFRRAIRGEHATLVIGDEILATARAIDRAYASLHAGGWRSLDGGDG